MTRSRGRKRQSPYYQTTARPRQQQVNTEPVRRGEVIDLGDLSGSERPELTASFTYFGESFRVHPDLSELDIIDFAESAEQLNPNDQSAMSMIKGFVRRGLHPGDFERFWITVKAHRQTAEETMNLMWKVIEGVTGNPTSPPSGSADGRSVTMQSSPPDVSSPATANGGQPSLRDRYIAQIERFEAMGTGMGAAMAAQVAVAAEARGVDVSREPAVSSNVSV